MIQHWLSAMRLRTLPLALSCVFSGTAIAIIEDSFQWSICILTIITTTLLQVLSNFSNDLGDFKNGADNAGRIGPQRAVQSGAISAEQMKNAVIITALLALLSGVSLLYVSLYDTGYAAAAIVMLLLGIGSIGAAVKYTAGKNPYGYRGLGDVFVFLFFGLVGVIGTAFLQTKSVEWWYVLPSISIGLLSTMVLNLNNMRDRVNDQKSGKQTLVVRMGGDKAKLYHVALFIGALVSALAVCIHFEMLVGLMLLPFVILAFHVKKVMATRYEKEYDPELKKVALSTFLVSILLLISALIFI
jgi:1,4-dihydroxy-2-naphthoate octaprenyltransferase